MSYPINPFVPNAPFLYPLKTSENLTAFWFFHGVEDGCTGNEWVKGQSYHYIENSRQFIYKVIQLSDFHKIPTSACNGWRQD